MADQDPVHVGECRCGQVRLKVWGVPVLTMACHCTGCQRMTASAFSLSTLYLSSNFQVDQGEPVIGGLHGATRHFFCPHCMSWLFTRPEGVDEFVNVRATMLDNAEGFIPFIEFYTSEALPWATTRQFAASRLILRMSSLRSWSRSSPGDPVNVMKLTLGSLNLPARGDVRSRGVRSRTAALPDRRRGAPALGTGSGERAREARPKPLWAGFSTRGPFAPPI